MGTSRSRRGERGSSPSRRGRVGERRAFPPATVVSLEPGDRSGGRFLLTVGDVEGVVSAELIGDFGLAVGRMLAPGEAAELTRAVHRLQVFDLAVQLLSTRARSARDLRVALRRKGATDDEARAALDRLTALQLLDDATYAREVARSRATGAGMSRAGLQRDLVRRGVAPAISRDAVEEVLAEPGLDEKEAALALARKRRRALAGLPSATARRRLYAFLARRGYEPGVIAAVVRDVLGGGAGAGDDDTPAAE